VANDLRRDQAGSGLGGTRTAIVAALLADALRSLTSPTSPGNGSSSAGSLPTVLDCGGGSGTFAVPLARVGARVTVIDISIDALATLTRRAAESGVGERVEPIQGDVEALADVIADREFDLVLAHGIFEVIDDSSAVFASMVAAVRPGGLLSVLVGNPVAAVLNRALAGDLEAAQREFDDLDSPSRVSPTLVRGLCAEHGLTVEAVHGVGVFSDFVTGAVIDVPGAREALAQLEVAGSTRSPFAEIAGRQHLLLRRPSTEAPVG
jgi:S-adenosylmethionine-dependent methyltransferase